MDPITQEFSSELKKLGYLLAYDFEIDELEDYLKVN